MAMTPSIPAHFLKSIDVDSLASLAAIGADIAMVVDQEAKVLSVRSNGSFADDYGLHDLIGGKLHLNVTVESVEKVLEMLVEAEDQGQSRYIQVNHAGSGLPDLPIRYRASHVPDCNYFLVSGMELSKQMAMQQKLVHAQLELERGFQDMSESERKYRSIFQTTGTPTCFVLADDLTMLDANREAIALLGKSREHAARGSFTHFVIAKDAAAVERLAERAVATGTAKIASVTLKESGPVEVEMVPLRLEGRSCLTVTMSRLTHLPEGNERAGFEPEAIPLPLLKMTHTGEVEQVNSLFLDLLKSPNENLVAGKRLDQWIGQSDVDLRLFLKSIAKNGGITKFMTVLRDWVGETVSVSLMARTDDDTDSVWVAILRDHSSSETDTMSMKQTSDAGFTELVGRIPLKDLIRESTDVVEKMCIESALEQTGNNKASTAEILGISRQSLYLKLKRHGLESHR